MEQHPVPQNISGFQFKLIGDMTIKQFGWLAGGILAGYIILQFGIPSLIKWLLAIIVSGAGFCIAFVPIEERSLDRWIIAFFKSVYSPTQFLWRKRPVPLEILTAPVPISHLPTPEVLKKEAAAAKIEEYLTTLPSSVANGLDSQEASLLTKIFSYFHTPGEPESPIIPQTPEPPKKEEEKPQPARFIPTTQQIKETPAVPPPTTPIPEPPKKEEEKKPEAKIDEKTDELAKKITSLQQELSNQTITRERFLEIQSQLSDLLGDKERLTKELISLKQMLMQKGEAAIRPTVMTQTQEESRVKFVSPSLASKIGMPQSPTFPNTLSGIIKTGDGAVLPGIIVEVRNRAGTPVRALKTGKLGQFTISTPLPDGTYTVHLEDPQKTFYFDIIEITLGGKIVAPLEILAKTQKDIQKEELKKKLFG